MRRIKIHIVGYTSFISIFCACFLLLSTNTLHAQASDSTALPTDSLFKKKPCEIKDASEYLREWLKMKPKANTKNSSMFFAPFVGSSPSTGFVVGATIQSAFQLPASSISAFQANISYTAKKQFTLSLKNNVFAKANRILLAGDWTYLNYSQPTYGLGTNAPNEKLNEFFHFNDVGESHDTLVQPMNFKYFKLHQTISFQVRKYFYIGPGIHFDRYSQIEDLNLDTAAHHLTSHYTYSKKYGFDPTKYDLVGLSLNLVYDSRDNMINAYKGIYANLNYRINPEFLGSDQNSSMLWAEFRSYTGVSKTHPEKVLAFWFVGNYTISGNLPYLTLPSIGNDQRGKTGRGYTTGRFRGNQMMYGEAEYRFPISKCTNTLGAVVFVNATTTNNMDTGVKLFEYVKPGFGIGLRILFQKQSRMNIQVDYGRGVDSGGVYFGASEVF
jgi:outer membrane protein assembly factor BamA